MALLVAGLLAGFIGFVVLGQRGALAVQQVLIATALLVWVAAKVTRRVRRRVRDRPGR